jgi:hypothetical protein
MIGRLLIVLAVAANVAVAAVSVTGSAWLWDRAGEPVVQREPVPALPSIVDETSVPFDQESARLLPAKKPVASPSQRAAKAANARRPARGALVSKRPRALRRVNAKVRTLPTRKRAARPKARTRKPAPVSRRPKPLPPQPTPAPAPTPPAPPAPQPVQPLPAPQPVAPPPPQQPVEDDADTGWKSKKPKKDKKPKKPKKDKEQAKKPKNDQWTRDDQDDDAQQQDEEESESDDGRSEDWNEGHGRRGNGHGKGHKGSR